MADEEIIDNEFKFLNLDSKIEYIGGKKEQTLEIPSSQLKYHVTANDLNQIASSFNEFTEELNDTYNFNINITSGLINKLDKTIDSDFTHLNNSYKNTFATLSGNYSELLTSNESLSADFNKLAESNSILKTYANDISGTVSKVSGETNYISSNFNTISGNIDTISSNFDSFTDTICGILPNLVTESNASSVINNQLSAYIPTDSAPSVVSSIIEEIKSENGETYIIPGFENLKLYITEYYPESNNPEEFIENIDTASSWYKLYNTGLLEQGGFIKPILNENTYQVINLLRPFKSAQIKTLVNAEFVALNGSALTVLPNNLNETIYYEVYGVQSSIENKDLTFKAVSNNLALAETESTENENTQTFAIAFTANNADNLALSYRINAENASENINWQTYSLNEIIVLQEGDKIQFKNESLTNFGEISGHFLTSGDFEVYGNINSLVNYQNNINTVSFGTLFENTNIINASQLALSYTKLSSNCYSGMFKNCIKLVYPPELPATTLANACYRDMFYGCTSLIKAPELPAYNLANWCYSGMFTNCTSLTKAPKLPADNFAEAGGCYNSMFYNCTSLIKTPELPATTLVYSCYSDMFRGCINLTEAPELPATNLADSCYENMFYGCTSLTEAPELPATTLVNNCYSNMFNGCTNLNYINVNFIEFGNNTTDWLNGVSTTGIFKCAGRLNTNIERSASTIPVGWDIKQLLYFVPTIEPITFNHSIKLKITDNSQDNFNNLYYRIGFTNNWTDWHKIDFESNITGFIIELPKNSNKSIQLWNFNNYLNNANQQLNILIYNPDNNININVQGNIQSLLNNSTELKQYCFYNLFNTGITNNAILNIDYNSLQLPITNLAANCYDSMFKNNTNLSSVPALPAKTLVRLCYNEMFSGCSKLDYLNVGFLDFKSSLYATNNWLTNTAATGKIDFNFIGEFSMENSLQLCYGESFIPNENWEVPMEFVPLSVSCNKNIDLIIDYTNNTYDGTNFKTRAETLSKNICYRVFQNGVWSEWLENLSFINDTTDSTNLKYTFNINNLSDNAIIQIWNKVNALSYFLSQNDGDIWYENAFRINGNIEDVFGKISSLINNNDIKRISMSHLFRSLFKDNTKLKTADKLILDYKNLGPYCYVAMFRSCTSLTKAPELPATTLANYCYGNMFWNCPSLIEAPKLPATILAEGCYNGMFRGCTNLTKAPELPATELTNYCYTAMFYGCSNLNYIKVGFTDWNKFNSSTVSWLRDVSNEGTFICSPDLDTTELGPSNIPENWKIETSYITNNEDTSTALTFTAEESNSTINLIANGSPVVNGLQYRLNANDDWQQYTLETKIILTNVGDYVQFQNTNNALSTSYSNYVQFKLSGKIAASGNIQSMLNYNDSCKDYCYYRMFEDCTSLTSAPKLTAITLNVSCYYHMFASCTNLIEAPELPAVTLADRCYSGMFNGCTRLTKASELPAITLAEGCYSHMFMGCINLIEAPELPVTTLANNCYNSMFRDCTSLTAAPNLLATTLSEGCYESMFRGCTNLTKAPELPATNILNKHYCYSYMFKDCASLTEVPYIPVKNSSGIGLSSGCFEGMFEGCSGLVVPITEDGNILTLSAATVYADSYKNMFKDCVNLTTLPIVSATILASGCFEGMFEGCSNLGNLSNYYIPGTKVNSTGLTAVGQSYKNMFKDCVNLTYPPMMSGIAGANGAEAFAGMYMNCSSLIEPPLINNINSISGSGKTTAYNICSSMFEGCTSLTSACIPNATTLNVGCYTSMYKGCTSLVDIPNLPATTLASNCYESMFEGCTSLENRNTNTSLIALRTMPACYKSMFKGCTSLSTSPIIKTTGTTSTSIFANECFAYMFEGCSNLNWVRTNFGPNCISNTNIPDNTSPTWKWLSGVSETGTISFTADTGWTDELTRNVSTIPEGWEIIQESNN